MKRFQILIIIFIILALTGLITGSACGYFQNKSNQDGSNIDNTDNINTNSSDDFDTVDSQTGTEDSQQNTGDGNDIIENPDTNSSNNSSTGDQQNNTDNSGKETNDSVKDSEPGGINDTVSDQIPQKYAIIASGASYDSQHYAWFLNSTSLAYKLLKNKDYQDENIYYLFESDKQSNVDYESTIGNFKKVVEELQEKTDKSDTIVLFLIGHGTYRDPTHITL